ncbi:drug-responsive transcription factor PDR1 Ecym_7235 [Eremothecium cymbalariae DBVPG|uniref:Zn(2)-C6 fungal-type domain-containing protein n=1 Tax=Eremothecium cymbalariae (strain CBS 270.75 / DBVPG 7215 / KCTC 17166 / NRRL Y-17582) TaxID=931890 RepID=G8JW66_ERECY|nr:hypothetical protein Ecym_7235 [Eremothecium cymbalariae DBVPG\
MVGKVKKSQLKIKRACDNCRRRKIKCTGTQPCACCVAYQCGCVYSSGGAQKGRAISTETTPGGLTIISSDSSIIQDGELKQQGCDGVGLGCGSVLSSLSDDTVAELIGVTPHEDHTGIWKRAEKLKGMISELEKSFKSQAIYSAIAKLQEELDRLQVQLSTPKVVEEFFKVPPNDPCLEAQLLKASHQDHIYLSKHSSFVPSKAAKYLGQAPFFDRDIGMYSSFISLSIRGIGYIFSQVMSPTIRASRGCKETLYITLRFFDLCFVPRENPKTWDMPLDAYFSDHPQLDGMVDSDIQSRIRYLISQISPNTVSKAIKVCPDLASLDTSSNSKCWYNRDNLKLCKYSIELLRHHHIAYTNTISRFSKRCGDEEILRCMKQFFEEEEILYTLFLETITRATYSIEPIVETLDLVTEFLDSNLQYGFGCENPDISELLAHAVSIAHECGLHRWEHYLVMDENTANRRREIWWKIYSWEIYHGMFSGKVSSTNQNSTLCLFPHYMSELGFLDSVEFFGKVLDYQFRFDKPLNHLLDYGHLAIALVTADFKSNVLFQRQYTDFRNWSKPIEARNATLKNIIKDIELLLARFDTIILHIDKLYSWNGLDSNGTSEIETTMNLKITTFIVNIESVLCSLILSSLSLLSRFSVDQNNPMPPLAESISVKLRKRLYDSWRIILNRAILECPSFEWTSLMSISLSSLIVLSEYFLVEKDIKTEDILMTLRYVRHIDKLYKVLPEITDTSKKAHDSVKGIIFSAILFRMVLQVFRNNHALDDKGLSNLILQYDPTLVTIASNLLDAESIYFKPCLGTQKKHFFHLSIKKLLSESWNSESEKSRINNETCDLSNLQNSGLTDYYKDPLKPCNSQSNSENVPIELQGLRPSGSSRMSPQPAPITNSNIWTSLNDPLVFDLGSLDEFVNYRDVTNLYSVLLEDFLLDSEITTFSKQH